MTSVEFNFQITNMQKALKYFAFNLTNDEDDAKDLLQETLYKALVNREKFVEEKNLKAWMYTIMKNIFINNYRRNARSNTFVDTTENKYFLNSTTEYSQEDPDIKYSQSEIEKGIRELDDDFRIPFEMHLQGYKYKEIAEQMQISIGTVKSRIFFTRKKLMKKLKGYEN